MEGALVAGGVTLDELQLLVPGFESSEIVLALFEHFAGFGEKSVLVIAGALQTPVLLGHLAHQNSFNRGGGTLLGDELIQQRIEFILVFPGEDQERARR